MRKPTPKRAVKKIRKIVRKRTVKKTPPKRAATKAARAPRKPIGKVTHYYTNIGVAIVKFVKPVRTGATVNFKGATTDFTQELVSLQYDHKPLTLAPKGKEVGVKVQERVRDGDHVFPV
ncbi:MAG: hypothetical protein HY536_00495 [Candidatus Colwellbacteria bacterium]|nr:hypothetical protein [Candidatus Colwellbacteria bacterium]